MKGNVPRAGTGARGYEGRIVRRQFPARRVETKHEDPIEPFVGHRDKPAARIEDGVVWMRTGLLFAIWPRFARQGHKIAARPQGSVLLDRHHADRAGAVIRSEEHTSELQSQSNLVCRLLLEKKKKKKNHPLCRKKKKTRKKNI